MAEYINREKLLDELGESASHHAESGREYQLLLRDRNIVREQPTANVIERFKIDNAIDEIIEKSFISDIYNDRTDDEIIKVDDVLEIFKKHIGE